MTKAYTVPKAVSIPVESIAEPNAQLSLEVDFSAHPLEDPTSAGALRVISIVSQ